MRRPAISLIATTAVLLALASPVLDLRMGDGGTTALPNSTAAKQGLLALRARLPERRDRPGHRRRRRLREDPATQQGLTRLRAELATDRDFAAGALTVETGPRIAVASVPLSVEPTSERASAAIDRLREDYVPRAFGAAADRVFVGGAPAEARDNFAVNSSWLPIVIAFVLALSFVLLLLAFRSIAIPLTAIAVNLLSVGAAYGILVLVFQKGVGADLLGFTQVERIDAWIPVFLFSVLFGLSMDYQVFLLSRIHERWSATGDTAGAIVHGVASTARLITGAAAIIIVVFTGFATGQLVAFQEMGFGIAIALALDATLVRLLLIPAAMRLLGERNWYLPRWLQWLPNLQVEGPPATTGTDRRAARRRAQPPARNPRGRMTKGSRHMPHELPRTPSQRRRLPRLALDGGGPRLPDRRAHRLEDRRTRGRRRRRTGRRRAHRSRDRRRPVVGRQRRARARGGLDRRQRRRLRRRTGRRRRAGRLRHRPRRSGRDGRGQRARARRRPGPGPRGAGPHASRRAVGERDAGAASRSAGARQRRAASASRTSSRSSAPTAQLCSCCSAAWCWRASRRARAQVA